MNNETQELSTYMREIADRSIHGDIDWVQPNPSTFHWLTPRSLVSIQKAISPKPARGLLDMAREEASYLFQVTDKGNRQVLVSMSSRDRPEFADLFERIYLSAERGMDARASKVLRSLLED